MLLKKSTQRRSNHLLKDFYMLPMPTELLSSVDSFPRIAILTNALPTQLRHDDELLRLALLNLQVQAEIVHWKSPEVMTFDAVLISSTWDYHTQSEEFLSTLKKVKEMGKKIYNPLPVIEWNFSKTYLKDLETLKLSPIESVYISSPEELKNLRRTLEEKGWSDCVIKPQVSASAYLTYRFNIANADAVAQAYKQFEENLFIVQPFAEEIVTEGEWSFIFIHDEYSHCVLKTPREDEFRVQLGTVNPIASPPAWMIERAQEIIRTIGLFLSEKEEDSSILKARVDVIRRGDQLRIMEIELIEPNLYLQYFPGSEQKLAKAIHADLQRFFKTTSVS